MGTRAHTAVRRFAAYDLISNLEPDRRPARSAVA